MKTYKVKELGKIITGKTPSTKNENFWNKNIYHFITPIDIKNNRYILKTERQISELAITNFKTIILPSNSLLISCIGYIGYVALTKKDKSISNQQINSIINIKNEIAIPLYLYYYFLKNKSFLKIIGNNGTTMPIIKKSLFEEIEITIHELEIQQHIVNTIGSVDDLIENYQLRIDKIIYILGNSLNSYNEKVNIEHYKPKIIKSGIDKFDINKLYVDTSAINDINKISDCAIIKYDNRPLRANMQPTIDTAWFAKMKNSNKKLIITSIDYDLINNYILSTGFLGIQATNNFPLTLISAILFQDNFNIQRDLLSVGTTMSGINNKTLLTIKVPYLNNNEILKYDKTYKCFIYELSSLRKKINSLNNLKQILLKKYF